MHEVGNGTEALAFLQKVKQPMVVLLDVIMPGMDGITLMEAVMRDPKLQRHHYIIMTATAGSYSTELTKIRRQMPISLMHKPFELERFLTLVKQHAK